MPQTQSVDAKALAGALAESISSYVETNRGAITALKPSHRQKFQWPPHPIEEYDIGTFDRRFWPPVRLIVPGSG